MSGAASDLGLSKKNHTDEGRGVDNSIQNSDTPRGGGSRGRARPILSRITPQDLVVSNQGPLDEKVTNGNSVPNLGYGRGLGRGRGLLVHQSGAPAPGLETPAKLRPFTLHHLGFEYKTLESASPKKPFIVTGGYSLNKLHIVPIDSRQLQMLTLHDTIASEVENLPFVEGFPEVGDILLALNKKSKLYMRVQVRDQVNASRPNSGLVSVFCVDTGRSYAYQCSQLKHVNSEIMNHNMIGYVVTLKDIPERYPKIYEDDFNKFITRIRENRVQYRVKLSRDGKFSDLIGIESRKSLSSEILNLGKWQWERIAARSNPCDHNDDFIYAAGDWGTYPIGFLPNTGPLPWDTYFQAQVCRDSSFEKTEGQNEEQISVFIKPLTTSWGNLKFTLDAQVNQYMEKVQRSAYFPAQNETVFVCFPKDSPRGGGTATKWHRMIRIDTITHGYYDVDRGKIFQIQPHDAEFRKVLPDFMRVPMLSMETFLLGIDMDNSGDREFVKSTFTERKRLHFRILKDDQDHGSGKIFVRCYELEQYVLTRQAGKKV